MATKELFEEIKDCFAAGDDNCETYRKYYFNHYSRKTLLTDDDIIMMVADSEDDDEPSGWATTMLGLEVNKVA